ncbi:MAG: AAA family ATPase, partial [Flavobacteriales bacterium]|nr:AAA family ATPase [Flavobacteriales bacterium]
MTESQKQIADVARAFQTEKKAELELYKKALEANTPQQRKKEGLSWFPIKVTETGYGLASLPFVIVERNPGDKTPHEFYRGTPLTVLNEGSKEQQFGHVLTVDDHRMRIALSGEDFPDWLDSADVSVNKVFDTKTFEEGEKALSQVLNAEKGRLKELRETLYGHRPPERKRSEEFEHPDLNESQNQAVSDIIETEDLSVVFGPPGTGKTTTLTQAIIQLVKREGKVLACAPSNAAVDHLTFQLVEKGVKCVRLGA